MRYLVRRLHFWWKTEFRAVDESGVTRFVLRDPSIVRAFILRLILLVTTVLTFTIWLVELGGGIRVWWPALALCATGVAESLARLRLTLRVEDERGKRLGRLRSWWPWRSWALSAVPWPKARRLRRTGRDYVVEEPGRPALRLTGDFQNQRYQLVRDGRLEARVVNHNREPSPSFIVEVGEEASPAPLLALAAAVELTHSRVRGAWLGSLLDLDPRS